MKKLLTLLFLVGASLAPAQVRALLVDVNDNPAAIAVDASGRPTVNINGSVTVTIGANSSINLNQVNSIAILTGAGATGTGSERVTVAQDTTTIAGSAPGTAGSASANVITIQGIASMTKLLVTPDSVALPANQSVNLAQVAGTNTLTGGIAGGLGVGGLGANASALVGNAVRIALSDNTNTRDWFTASQGADAQGGLNIAGIARQIYNGTNYDRTRSAALATNPTSQTTTARNSIGVQLIEKGSRWFQSSNPASGSQASVVLASETSVRHVVDCIGWSGDSSAAVTATALTVQLLDGATVMVPYAVSAGVAAGAGIQDIAPFAVCGLNMVGTTATSTTIQFSAGVTGLVETVWMSGYNVI